MILNLALMYVLNDAVQKEKKNEFEKQVIYRINKLPYFFDVSSDCGFLNF